MSANSPGRHCRRNRRGCGRARRRSANCRASRRAKDRRSPGAAPARWGRHWQRCAVLVQRLAPARRKRRQQNQANGKDGAARCEPVATAMNLSRTCLARLALSDRPPPAVSPMLARALLCAVGIAAKIGSLGMRPQLQSVRAERAACMSAARSAKKARAPQTALRRTHMAGTVEKKLQELGITLAKPRRADRQLRAVRAHRQSAARIRPALLRRRRQARRQGPARRRRLDRRRPKGGARLRDQSVWRRSRPRSAISTRSRAWCGSAASSIRRRAFADGPKVMNGASDLMVAVFGDKGRHARSTVGVAALPADAAVEVEGLFEVS